MLHFAFSYAVMLCLCRCVMYSCRRLRVACALYTAPAYNEMGLVVFELTMKDMPDVTEQLGLNVTNSIVE